MTTVLRKYISTNFSLEKNDTMLLKIIHAPFDEHKTFSNTPVVLYIDRYCQCKSVISGFATAAHLGRENGSLSPVKPSCPDKRVGF